MFITEPRNWKWMIPGALVAPLWIAAEKAWLEWGWGDWSMALYGLMGIMVIATLLNGWAYVAEHWADTFANIRSAMNSTPEVRMFEAAKGMHPEVVKMLMAHRRTIWRIKYVPAKDLVDWIMDEIPTVHAGFVDFVLDHSNGALMSKRLLSEGSKQFDPEELVTDYQQYDDLVLFMQQKLMVTQAYGNQPPQLIPPWTRETLRHRFGLDGEGYEIEDGITEAMQSVVRAQGKSNGNGVKPLVDAQKVITVKAEAPKVIDVPAMTDDELAAIEKENQDYLAKIK